METIMPEGPRAAHLKDFMGGINKPDLPSGMPPEEGYRVQFRSKDAKNLRLLKFSGRSHIYRCEAGR